MASARSWPPGPSLVPGVFIFFSLGINRWTLFIARKFLSKVIKYKWFSIFSLIFSFFLGPLVIYVLSLVNSILLYIIVVSSNASLQTQALEVSSEITENFYNRRLHYASIHVGRSTTVVSYILQLLQSLSSKGTKHCQGEGVLCVGAGN